MNTHNRSAALKKGLIANEAIFHNSHDGIICIDGTSTIIFVNEAVVDMFGYANEMDLVGQSVEMLMNAHQGAQHGSYVTRHMAGEDVPIMNRLRRLRARHASGHLFPVDIHVVQVEAEGAPYYVGFLRDMSEIEAKEHELHRLLYYDTLTGLPNTKSVERFLDEFFATAQDDRLMMALMGIDHMRSVNFTFGFEVGDAVFKAVGERLRRAASNAVFFGRLEGDQFVAFFDLDGADARELAQSIDDRITEALSYPVEADQARVTVSITAGFIPIPDLAETTPLVLKHAEMIYGEAKRKQRGGHMVLTEGKLRDLSETAALTHRIRDALQLQEFFVVVQPKVDLTTGRCTAGECLIRWRQADGTFVPPAHFIPVAENADLINNIGQFVYSEACGFLKRWQADPVESQWRLAVNLSPRQLEKPAFTQSVTKVLYLLGVSARQLEFEVTETALANSPASAIAVLEELREIGFEIGLDDFGTGYSSLSALRFLPIDRVKVDRSFLKDFETERRSYDLVRNTIALAKDLGLKVTVEGVETEETAHKLSLLGVDEAQGYYYSRPVSLAEFEAFARAKS